MNDKYPYGIDKVNGSAPSYMHDYLSKSNPEVKTNQNIEALNRLFDEANYGDDTLEEFSLDHQANSNFGFNSSSKSQDSSFYNEPSKFFENDIEDPLDKTMEINSVNLPEVKKLLAELHEIYDEPSDEEKVASEGQSQSKGRTLTKATKQGIAFSNGSMTRTFLDCVVLCFITASMGFGMFMYIFSQL